MHREETRMLASVRAFTAALVGVAMLATSAPALASEAGIGRDDGGVPGQVPYVVDAVILRPLGLLMTAGGLILYAFPVLPLVAITRPSDMFKPLGPLVAAPAKYTFSDPLGYH
jgi:hypothetical protein